MNKRLDNQEVKDTCYEFDLALLSHHRPAIPYAIVYETSHFGDKTGIVTGTKNRNSVMPLIKTALNTPYQPAAYARASKRFETALSTTFRRVEKLKGGLLDWDKQEQYEGHAQLIIRLRDQFGEPVEHFDINFKSKPTAPEHSEQLENMIEDRRINNIDKGSITFYLRTQSFAAKNKANKWVERLNRVAPIDVEITGTEALSDEIAYVPLTLSLQPDQVNAAIQSFRTTVIDVTLVRLPSAHVFEIH
jgi:hypothetical protein